MSRKLKNLWTEHAILEAKIDREQRRPLADNLRLSSLKRMKLAIRDEIAKLEDRLHNDKPARRGMKFA